MMPLRTTQMMLIRFGLLQDENSTSWQKLACVLFIVICIVLIAIQLIASAIFATQFLLTDLERTLYAAAQVLIYSPIMYMLLATILMRSKITALIEEVTMIFNSIDGHDSKRFILEADNYSEWLWKIYIRYGIIGYRIGSLVSSASSVLWSLFKYGKIDTHHMYHQFELTLPWNTRTTLGYFGEIFFSIAVSEIYMAFAGTILLAFISLCLYHQAFYRIFEYSLHRLDDCVNERNQKKKLGDLIRFHNTAKGLFSHSADIWSHFILVVMLFTALALASIVFQMDLGLRHMGGQLLFLPIPFLVFNLNIFSYCYYGKLATESYQDMAQCLFDANWPGLSIEVQTYFLLMIQNTQRPLHYHGFGIFILNLETYTKLIKLVYTCYMMQKTVTN